ncbi:hypothetical protein [Clostridium sp.]|uniref:hypothetical protein n=1 Tax=Clostridium sp. TaxID=1506 RepID=UPI002FCB32D0
MDNDKIFDLISKMYCEMQEGFKKVNKRLDKIESKLENNTVLLENANANIKTLAEVQGAFSE